MPRLHWRGTDFLGHPMAFRPVRWFFSGTNLEVIPEHTHDFAEVFWIEEGEVRHYINGEVLRAKPGCLYMIRPDDCHRMVLPKGSVRYINIAFPLSTLEFLKQRYFARDPNFFGGDARMPLSHQLTSAQIDRFAREYEIMRLATGSQFEIDRFLLSLFKIIGVTGPDVAGESVPDWLDRACLLIRQTDHLAGGTVRFCELAGRSPEHVSREVRRWFGCTPTDLVTRARLEHAGTLLAGSNMEIIDIAAEIGFKSLSQFYKVFTRHFGTTPRRFRVRGTDAVAGSA